MADNFDNRNGYNPYNYNYTNQMDYYKKLEQENAVLKEQMRQNQFVDPLYSEFQQSGIYQEQKKNNVLTFLFLKFFGEWQQSDVGKQFVEWDKKEFENFKKQKGATRPNPNSNNNGVL